MSLLVLSVECVYIGLATKRLRVLPLCGIDKSRNHLVAKPISFSLIAFTWNTHMSHSAVSVVFAKRIYKLLGQIDGLRRTHICGGNPQRVKSCVIVDTKQLHANLLSKTQR